MKFRTIINFNVSRTTFFFVFSFCSPIEYLLCVHSLSLSLTKQGKTRGVFSGHIHRPHSKRETWNIPSNIIGLLFIRCGYWCVVSTGRILAWTMHRATGLLSFLTQKFKLTKMSSLLPLEYWFFLSFFWPQHKRIDRMNERGTQGEMTQLGFQWKSTIAKIET